jgi:hypothetical protein
MGEDTPLPFELPAVAHREVSAAFDGGRITSAGGSMLLAQVETWVPKADYGKHPAGVRRRSAVRGVDLPRFSGEALAHLAACFSN